MSANFDRFRPDFEAEMHLPEWLQMGGDDDNTNQQSLDIHPFVSALKKRMNRPPDSGGIGAVAGGAMAGKPAGGRMQSL